MSHGRGSIRGVAGALMAVLALHVQAIEGTLCAPSEHAVFSCSTGTKTVSVCRSQDLTAISGAVQYRFGRPVAVELEIPPEGADWRAITRGGTLTYSGGGGAFLAFTNAAYRYTVYSAVGKGWGSKSGVVVEKSGKRIASLACKGKAVSELGPDLFSEAGVAEADEVFDLPR